MKPDETYYTELIASYLGGEASPDAIRELERWLKSDPANRDFFISCRDTWEKVTLSSIENSVDLDREWDKLKASLPVQGEVKVPLTEPGSREMKKRVPVRFIGWTLRVAAVGLILFAAGFILWNQLKKPGLVVIEATSGTREVTLADGSTITLNQGSSLTHSTDYSAKNRSVMLKGEAWFEVASNPYHPFTVSFSGNTVTVLGTTFNINTLAFGNTSEVILVSGKISLGTGGEGQEDILLAPGQRASVSHTDHSVSVTGNNDPNFLAWKTRAFVFDNTPMTGVVALLTRVYHRPVSLGDPALASCRVTASFSNQPLESVLNVLKATLDLRIENREAGIVLHGKGCK